MTDTNGRPGPQAPAPAPDEELKLLDVWHVLMRNRRVVMGVMLGVVLLAAGWTWMQRPVYQSGTTLIIEDDKPDNPLAELTTMLAVPGREKIETEMVVLRSRQLSEAVVDSLSLTLQLLAPAVSRHEILRPLDVPRNAPVGVFKLERRGDAYALSVEKGAKGVQVPEQVRPGTPFKIGNATIALAPRLVRDGPDEIRFALESFRLTSDDVQKAFNVGRVDPRASVVSLTYETTDRHLAAEVPNMAAATFTQDRARLSRLESSNTVAFLRDQVGSYEGQLLSAENSLRSFRERERVVSPQEEAKLQVGRLAELQAEHDRLRGERDALGQLLNRIASRPVTANGRSPYRELASFPVFLSNRAVQDMLQSLTTLENRRAELLVQRTAESVDVQGIDERVRELELQLYQIARNYQEGLESQIGSAQSSLGRFGTQLQLIPAREVEFARLARQQKLLDEIYTLLQTRLKEAEIREAVVPNEVRVLDPARLPVRPISPRPVRSLALGVLAGLVFGVMAAFAREALDTRIRSKADVQAAAGNLPVLGIIPQFRKDGATRGNRLRRIRTPELTGPIAFADPRSPAAEAFRALRTSVMFSGIKGPPRLLVVTSAMPGDGKSTTSANLAVTTARQGGSTVLIDADMRRGTLHHTFDIPQEPGLTHVLLGMCTLDEAVATVELEDGFVLHVLPTGVLPPNPSELLMSDQMSALLEEVRNRYQTVILDAPPLNLVTDAAILAKKADSTLLVTRTGVTDKRDLQHAAAQLTQVHAAVSGVVLNGVDVEGSASYYGYHSGYGSYTGYAAVGNASSNGKKGTNGRHP